MPPDDLASIAVDSYGAVQKAEELRDLIEMVRALAPRVIVEIGSYAGGTLHAWTSLAPHVYAVDLEAASMFAATSLPRQAHGATVIAGDSHRQETLDQLRAALPGPVDFLFIDGDHTYDGVRQDYLMYSPLVRTGGIVAFHDIIEHSDRGGIEVHRLWREIKNDQAVEIIRGEGNWGGIGIMRASKEKT